MDPDLIRDYTGPPHPAAFSGLGKLRKLYPDKSERELKKTLSGIDAYTRHKEPKPVKKYNPVVVRYRLQLLQLDLLNVDDFEDENDGVKYLLMIVDTFSRKAWCLPLRNKEAPSVLAAFGEFLERTLPANLRDKVERVLCDRGKEFNNGEFKSLLREHGIELSHPNRHAPHVERLNKSFQRILYAYMTERRTRRYLDKLPSLLASYNGRPHSAHGLSPEDAFKKINARRVNYALAAKQEEQLESRKGRPRFRVGDYVRMRERGKAFDRSYKPTHRQELYRIHAVLSGPLPETMYKLSGLRGEIVAGKFYANQLAAVTPNERMFRVEKVEEERVRRGRREYLVKYLGYGKNYNAWIGEEELARSL